jgi:hypothetical protein
LQLHGARGIAAVVRFEPNPHLASRSKREVAISSLRYLLGAVAAAAVLAGCGSQAQVNPSGAMAPSVARGPVAAVKGGKKGGCIAHGAARVDPCAVTFTASSSGPDTVTTRHPHDKKGTFTESDNCTSTGSVVIATVTQSSTPNEWTVTAGSATGSCTATFDYANKRGKVVGWAELSITNDI